MDKLSQTNNSNSERDGQQQKDNSRLTIGLLKDGQMREYNLLNEAMKQLKEKPPTSTDTSSLTAIIIEPDRSKNSQCSFEKLLSEG
ncbi:hypothetical protein [Nostoc sp. UHCC 0251]|uniref:hypothetical protein n=1 Tax=Nostoc sp. UHCC 0251 TaxID=3110240 RepID=UPI002B211AC3|nr:hypothetical protein [Nostoc sp. UHCC 0251]MEA5626530.1 hypothetical protein [Nostoc sp. UHCC 0251]